MATLTYGRLTRLCPLGLGVCCPHSRHLRQPATWAKQRAGAEDDARGADADRRARRRCAPPLRKTRRWLPWHLPADPSTSSALLSLSRRCTECSLLVCMQGTNISTTSISPSHDKTSHIILLTCPASAQCFLSCPRLRPHHCLSLHCRCQCSQGPPSHPARSSSCYYFAAQCSDVHSVCVCVCACVCRSPLLPLSLTSGGVLLSCGELCNPACSKL